MPSRKVRPARPSGRVDRCQDDACWHWPRARRPCSRPAPRHQVRCWPISPCAPKTASSAGIGRSGCRGSSNYGRYSATILTCSKYRQQQPRIHIRALPGERRSRSFRCHAGARTGVLVLHSGLWPSSLAATPQGWLRIGVGGMAAGWKRRWSDGGGVQAAAGQAPRLPERRSRPLDPSTAIEQRNIPCRFRLPEQSIRPSGQPGAAVVRCPDRLRRGN